MDTFKSFFHNTVVTKDRKVIRQPNFLGEGIEHIEALPHDKFIKAIRNISKFIASEKLDGSNLTFGFDNNGSFYTSRESKGGQRFFSVSEYENFAANNGNKSAHMALEKMSPLIKTVMKDGDACEVELLFGRQPNAIVYGSNYIAFLRMIIGDNKETPDQSKVKELGELMRGKSVKIKVPIVTTPDGVELKTETVDHTWKFSSVSYIDKKHFQKVNVNQELSEFERWLSEKHPTGYTHGDLLQIKLPSVPKEIRNEVKAAREDAIKKAQDEFMLPIKEKFLDNVMRKIKPALRDVEVSPGEDIGIEGAVFLDPETQEQFKIVDKDVFTVVNQFNYSIRNQLKSPTRGRQSFDTATLGLDGDIFNRMLERIAVAIGVPAMGHISGIKRTLSKYKGETQEETIANFLNDFKDRNTTSLKKSVSNAIDVGLVELNEALKKFNQEKSNYSLRLKTGRNIGYTDEINSRTLMVFAEMRKELLEMKQRVNSSNSPEGVVIALYGNKLKEIH